MGTGLYIHIPFCARKCAYCDFLSIEAARAGQDMIARTARAVASEIRMRLPGARLSTIYIGGGTPSLLHEDAFGSIFSAIRASAAVEPDAEITVEANPGTIGSAKAEALRALGVNRMSLGVQSMDNAELRTLGRIHTEREAAEAVRAMPFDNVSIDLMYAIPGQTRESWRMTLEKALALRPSHVSAYELTPEPRTPLYDALSRGELRMPDEETAVAMQRDAVAMLASAGLMRYEISNYARMGMRSRHNTNYWERGEYIGIGPAAHSFMMDTPCGTRTSNTSDIAEYCEMVESGRAPLGETLTLTREEAARETLFLGLRMVDGVSVGDTGALAGLDVMGAAARLIEDGFMERDARMLRLTPRGMLMSNSVLVSLFAALGL